MQLDGVHSTVAASVSYLLFSCAIELRFVAALSQQRRAGSAFSEINDFARTPPLTPLRLRLYIRHVGLHLRSRLYFPLSPFDFLLRQRTRIPTRWIYGTWTFTLGLITASTNAADRSFLATINLKARSRRSVRNPLAVLPPQLDNRRRLPRARNFPSKELWTFRARWLNFALCVLEV